MSIQVWFVLCCSVGLCWSGGAAAQVQGERGRPNRSVRAVPEDRSEFPNVLLIGDSISIGYTPFVQEQLSERADVFRIPGNGKATDHGLKNLDKWLGSRDWDVIHFNWGLWDLCYRHPQSKVQGNRDKVNGALTTTPERYRDSLQMIVARLKKTGARLIWCTTTPVPEHEAGRRLGDDRKYNRIAEMIMKKERVLIDDLHSHALKRFDEFQVGKGDVHFTTAGYAYLAEKVVDEISGVLPDVQHRKIEPKTIK